MKVEWKDILIAIALVLVSCGDKNVPDVAVLTSECAAIPTGLASASATVMNGKAYIIGGRDASGKYQNDLWQYDATADTWSKVSSLPGKARVKPVIISDNSSLYMGLGFSGESAFADSCFLRDWWKYTPSSNSWTRLADYPDVHSNAAVSYIVGNRIYAIYGFGLGWSSKVMYYDITTDSWHSAGDNSDRAKPTFGGVGAQCNGRCFYGTGYRNANTRQWYEVDLNRDDWTERTKVPGKGRELCAGCATNEYIYIFGGRCFGGEYTGGEVLKEALRYKVDEDKWERCGDIRCGRAENMVAFSIGNKAYYGLGETDEGQVINKLYRIE